MRVYSSLFFFYAVFLLIPGSLLHAAAAQPAEPKKMFKWNKRSTGETLTFSLPGTLDVESEGGKQKIARLKSLLLAHKARLSRYDEAGYVDAFERTPGSSTEILSNGNRVEVSADGAIRRELDKAGKPVKQARPEGNSEESGSGESNLPIPEKVYLHDGVSFDWTDPHYRFIERKSFEIPAGESLSRDSERNQVDRIKATPLRVANFMVLRRHLGPRVPAWAEEIRTAKAERLAAKRAADQAESERGRADTDARAEKITRESEERKRLAEEAQARKEAANKKYGKNYWMSQAGVAGLSLLGGYLYKQKADDVSWREQMNDRLLDQIIDGLSDQYKESFKAAKNQKNKNTLIAQIEQDKNLPEDILKKIEKYKKEEVELGTQRRMRNWMLGGLLGVNGLNLLYNAYEWNS